jgi:hypothetical protein
MKQAVLIIAYKDIEHLIDIVNFFDEDFLFYIHIKKSSQIDNEALARLKSSRKVVLVSRKYEVRWGGFNLLKAILYLSQEALKNKEVEYFHLISGQDFPIKKSHYFTEFLQKHKGKEFIEYVTPPSSQFLKRLSYFYLFDFIDSKRGKGNVRVFTLVKLQKRLGLNRNKPDMVNLAVGSAWWTLSYGCLQYVIAYTKNNPSFLNRMKYTWCPEEFYFQSVLLNSCYKEIIVNNNFRYIDWVSKNGSHPAILDESDYDRLLHSPQLFARKFERPVSDKLIEKLRNNHVCLHQ